MQRGKWNDAQRLCSYGSETVSNNLWLVLLLHNQRNFVHNGVIIIYDDDTTMIVKSKDFKEIIGQYRLRVERFNININFRKSHFFKNGKCASGEEEKY